MRDILHIGFVFQQGEKQEIYGAFTGTDKVMKQVLFAGEDATDTICFEFGIRQGHLSSHFGYKPPSWGY